MFVITWHFEKKQASIIFFSFEVIFHFKTSFNQTFINRKSVKKCQNCIRHTQFISKPLFIIIIIIIFNLFILWPVFLFFPQNHQSTRQLLLCPAHHGCALDPVAKGILALGKGEQESTGLTCCPSFQRTALFGPIKPYNCLFQKSQRVTGCSLLNQSKAK